MKQARRGKIINVSGGGATSPTPNFSAYAVSKAGLVRLTETLAKEVGQYNIQVNAMAPGTVVGKMTEDVVEAGLMAAAEVLEGVRKLLTEGSMSPAKAAVLATFLASSDSNGITGKLVNAVHDNWTEWSEYSDVLANPDLYTLCRLDPFTIRKLVPELNLPWERR